MILYRICRFIALILCRLLFNIRACGRENIPSNESFILASNHASYLDPIIIGVSCSRILNFMAKESIFKNRFFGWFLTQLGCFPIKRNATDPSAIKEALRRLGEGRALLLFPHGTRSQGINTIENKAGVGFLVEKARVAVVPVFVKGTDKAWPKYKRLPRSYPVSVYFGRPIAYQDGLDRAQLTDNVISEIAKIESKCDQQ